MSGSVNRRDSWALIAVVAVAGATRLSNLTLQSYSIDEAATIAVLRRPFSGMFWAISHHESTPPLYYLLARLWSEVGGLGEASLRSESALAGVITAALVFLTARRIAGVRAGLIAGGLTAISPLLVWYSQEARAYSLLAMFGALSFLCATAAVDAGHDSVAERRWLTGWALAAALGLCTHYFAVLFVVPEAAWLALRRPRRARWAIGAVGVVALALLPLALAQRSTGRTDWISGSPLHTRLILIPKQFATGLSAPHQTILAACVALAVVALLAVLTDAARRRTRVPEAAVVAALGVVGAAVALVLLAAVGIDLVLTRNALGILPIAVVAVAVGIELGLRGPWRVPALLAALAMAAVSVVGLAGMFTDARYQRPNWRAAAEVVNASPGAHVMVSVPPENELPLGLYVRGLRRPSAAVLETSEVDVVTYLLTINGVPRARTSLPVLAHFRALPPRRWFDVEVTRLLAASPRPVDVDRLGERDAVELVGSGRDLLPPH
jgi:uncharacterized membrane protein